MQKNMTTLAIILLIITVAGMASLIHYYTEQSREEKTAAHGVLTEKNPVVQRQTPIRNAVVSDDKATAVNQTKSQDNSITIPANQDSSFKSPIGVILDVGTAVIRETDKAAQNFLPPVTASEEQQIGKEINKIIETNTPEWKDNESVKNAKTIFNKLLHYTKRTDITYQLAVLDKKNECNAYAVLGGYVYITRAMLERFDSDAAIALYLGHELGHLEARHTTERLRTMMAARKLVGADVAMIAQAAYKMVTNCYAKDQEFEADEIGLRISLKAGFSREQMLAFFSQFILFEKENKKKSSMTAVTEKSPVLQDMEYFFQGHPYSAERYERLKQLNVNNQI